MAQPGDLGDSDDDTAAPAAATTTTTVDDAGTTTTLDEPTTTTVAVTSTTTAPDAAAGDTTNTTQPGSGIGAGGAGTAGKDIANTGHESALVGGLLLLGAGLALRRAVG